MKLNNKQINAILDKAKASKQVNSYPIIDAREGKLIARQDNQPKSNVKASKALLQALRQAINEVNKQ